MSDVVIDTSAAIAVLTGGEDGGSIIGVLDRADRRRMSAASAVEVGIVLGARFGPVAAAILERFLRAANIDVEAVDREQADVAIEAWLRFGKGRHPASLNYGDCFPYALATVTGAALVCTGDDFSHTDLTVLRPRES